MGFTLSLLRRAEQELGLRHSAAIIRHEARGVHSHALMKRDRHIGPEQSGMGIREI